jgi:hypothetical protein
VEWAYLGPGGGTINIAHQVLSSLRGNVFAESRDACRKFTPQSKSQHKELTQSIQHKNIHVSTIHAFIARARNGVKLTKHNVLQDSVLIDLNGRRVVMKILNRSTIIVVGIVQVHQPLEKVSRIVVKFRNFAKENVDLKCGF